MAHDDLTRQVLERAQREVAERKAAVVLEQPRQPRRLSNERPWLWAFIGLVATLCIGALVVLPGTFVDRLGWIVHGVCAQEHTLVIAGVEMPLCQRNTGIYSGFLASLLTLALMGRGRAAKLPLTSLIVVLIAQVLLMGIDGFNSLLLDIGAPYLYTPQPVLRILSGLAMGMTVATFVLFAINITMRANPRRDQRIIAGWGDWAILWLVSLALFGLIRLGGAWLVYPLAIFSTLGILLVMFAVNVLIVAMIGRYENAITRLTQLARPGVIAVVLTVAEFGLLAWGRIAVERSLGVS